LAEVEEHHDIEGEVSNGTNRNITKWHIALADPCIISKSVAAYADWKVEGVSPTAVVVIDLQTLEIEYSANVLATDVAVIPNNSLAIRTMSGGFVNATAHTFS
jgi:hypothetical protein